MTLFSLSLMFLILMQQMMMITRTGNRKILAKMGMITWAGLAEMNMKLRFENYSTRGPMPRWHDKLWPGQNDSHDWTMAVTERWSWMIDGHDWTMVWLNSGHDKRRSWPNNGQDRTTVMSPDCTTVIFGEGAKNILRGWLLKFRTSPFENTYPPKNGDICLDPP